MSPNCHTWVHSPRHAGWLRKRRDGDEAELFPALSAAMATHTVSAARERRSVSAVLCSLKPGTPLMLGRPTCSPGLMCFGDEAVGWRRLHFHCQGRGWMAAGRSSSVDLSLPRLTPTHVREAGAEKGPSASVHGPHCPGLVHLQRRAGHGRAPMCYPRGSWHGQPARPGATREEDRDRDGGSAAPWLAPSISPFFSCEAQGGVSASLCGATLSPRAALWGDGTATRPSAPRPLSFPGPCHSLPFQLSCWPMSLSSRIHCLVSL